MTLFDWYIWLTIWYETWWFDIELELTSLSLPSFYFFLNPFHYNRAPSPSSSVVYFFEWMIYWYTNSHDDDDDVKNLAGLFFIFFYFTFFQTVCAWLVWFYSIKFFNYLFCSFLPTYLFVHHFYVTTKTPQNLYN